MKIERMDKDELLGRIKKGEKIVVMDVRLRKNKPLIVLPSSIPDALWLMEKESY